MKFLYSTLLAAAFLIAPGIAHAKITARVSVATQTMTVTGDGVSYHWMVSTAGKGHHTPHGTFHPTRLDRYHKSSQYNNAPMNYSVFFSGGAAIHETPWIAKLGSPASKGCVRLNRSNAATFFAMVKSTGKKNVTIIIQ